MTIKIDKDVPFDPPVARPSLMEEVAEAMKTMEIGDSFKLEGNRAVADASYCVDLANRASAIEGSFVYGKTFVIKKRAPVDPTMPGARMTCRVWRIK